MENPMQTLIHHFSGWFLLILPYDLTAWSHNKQYNKQLVEGYFPKKYYAYTLHRNK